jgi:hypothetical protein
MDTTFFALWVATLLFDGLLMAGLTWAATSARFGKYRIRCMLAGRVPPACSARCWASCCYTT